MGFEPGYAPEPIPELIQEVLYDVENTRNIQGGYIMVHDVEFVNEESLFAANHTFHTGDIVAHYLKEAEHVVFFLVTAGDVFENQARKLMTEGDPMKGYIYDVLGSETVESTVDILQESLQQEMIKQGMQITNRYCPGYCGWPVSDQFKLFKLFPDNFCGITLNQSALMHPVKSESGIIGIGKNAKKQPYSCQVCDAKNCIYRDKR